LAFISALMLAAVLFEWTRTRHRVDVALWTAGEDDPETTLRISRRRIEIFAEPGRLGMAIEYEGQQPTRFFSDDPTQNDPPGFCFVSGPPTRIVGGFFWLHRHIWVDAIGVEIFTGYAADDALWPPVHGYHVAVPFAIPASIFAAWPLWWAIRFRRRRREMLRSCLGLCANCGYDLRGSRGRCPECGTAYSPDPKRRPDIHAGLPFIVLVLCLVGGCNTNSKHLPIPAAAGVPIEVGGHALVVAALLGDVMRVNRLLSEGISCDARLGSEEDILPGEQWSFAGQHNWTALQAAAYRGRVNVVRRLLAAGAQVDSDDGFGAAPLMFAIDRSEDIPDKQKCTLLLLQAGANVNLRRKAYIDDVGGSTPLHLAILERNVDLVKALLAKGADVNAKRDDGSTPLDIADPTRVPPEIIDALLAAGARRSN
jgi:hypothetical protein